MGEKLIVGPINKGLRTDRLPFVIDNDSFPILINAYQWRGRIKRKRGTAPLGRLTRTLISVLTPVSNTIQVGPIMTLDGSGNGSANLITLYSLGSTASITPGSITLKDGGGGGNTFTEPNPPNGTLVSNAGPFVFGSINYATGAITISGGQATTKLIGTFSYYPGLPVMGIEDLYTSSSHFPGNITFDTTYSYNITTTTPFNIYDVSFYKNPATNANLPGYSPKSNQTPLTWNGQNYQQFWSTNYQGAMWATNGIPIPFNSSNIGMQFILITGITFSFNVPLNAYQAVITFAGGTNFVVGDFVFINEVVGINGINYQSGYITAINGNASQITVTFPDATLSGAYSSGGIVQALTNTVVAGKDCIRWFDGDTTINSGINGWVNFMPPLNQFTAFPNFSISSLPSDQYYLVSSRMIVQFKDRLLFIGPVVQTSTGSPVYLQDTVIYSQNGTAYYTSSYTNSPNPNVDNPTAPISQFPILVPVNQTAFSPAYFEDQTGFGGFITSGLDMPINTVGANEDALIMGHERAQTKFLYTGNDVIPFVFYIVNSELGSSSTFSTIVMDEGVISRGRRGFTITTQQKTERVDLDILDNVFEFNLNNNGTERICSQRDYLNEWIYFTYSFEQFTTTVFPSQTLLFNYRDNTWANFNETYTTYGTFRQSSDISWASLPSDLTWNTWNDPWNSGENNDFQPVVIAGNQQGFIIIRDTVETNEAPSLFIQSFSGNFVTSSNHGLNSGDYIMINGCLGTIGSQVNGKIFQISSPNISTFTIDPAIGSGTYLGGGTITRMYIPFIQTKQFPTSWSMARKTRIGPQQYLLTMTPNAQITLSIFLSQDSAFPYNSGNVVPAIIDVFNNSLIYSTILYTCPESTNLGLTPANTNLQMIVDPSIGVTGQQQIWHRINTSLIGDTVQLAFTLSDAQMTAVDGSGNPISQFAEIELHAFILDLQPSQLLA